MYRGIDADDNHGVIVRADHVRGYSDSGGGNNSSSSGGGGGGGFGRGIIIIIIIMVATAERCVVRGGPLAHHPLRISPRRNWSEVFAGAR